MTYQCKPVASYLPGGFVRRRGKAGQLQLAKAVARQFKDCVPVKNRWRVHIPPPTYGDKQQNAHVFIDYYVGPLTKRERERQFEMGEGDRGIDRAGADIRIGANLHIKFEFRGDFPVEYLDETIRKL
jgi:hypothetical protein